MVLELLAIVLVAKGVSRNSERYLIAAAVVVGTCGITKVVGMEARGFIIAAPVAYRMGAGFVPVRKAGKLPWQVIREEYSLEYGSDKLEVHRDAIFPGERILVIDDVLATGGTAAATVRLVEALNGIVVGIGVLIELEDLGGRAKLVGHRVESLARY